MKKRIMIIEVLILILSIYTVGSIILMYLNMFPRGIWNFVSCATGMVAFILFMYMLYIRHTTL
jgi:hypothetical protein